MIRPRISPLVMLSLMGILCSLSGCTPDTGGGPSSPAGGAGSGKRFSLFEFKEPEPPAPNPNSVWPPRAVWVVRQEWKSPAQIAALMEQIRQAGLNTVLFQVRGNGTVYYRSSIEPFEYSDPGFDPLEVACREAHRRGLALQAWVNVMPAWSGRTPPSDPRQLYNVHPDWFLYDQNGRRQPLSGWYVSLNPCLPEVRQYLVNVFSEIVHRYPVDGLQLDYIRIPTDQSPAGSEYPYDPRTLALYRQTSGKRPRDSKSMWIDWRARQVTQLVREIRQMTLREKRSVRLTASCGVAFDRWKPDYAQDGPTWLRDRLVDLVFVMNYSRDTNVFVRRQQAWHRAAPGTWIAAGIGVTEHPSASTTIDQLRHAAQWGHGFSLFSNAVLFSGSPSAQARLDAIRPALLSMLPRATAMMAPDDLPQLAQADD